MITNIEFGLGFHKVQLNDAKADSEFLAFFIYTLLTKLHEAHHRIHVKFKEKSEEIRPKGKWEEKQRWSQRHVNTKMQTWDAVYSPWATNLAPSSHEKRESWSRSQFRVLSRGSPGGPQQSWNKEPFIPSLCTEQIRWDVASKVLNNAYTAGTCPDDIHGYGYTEISHCGIYQQFFHYVPKFWNNHVPRL